MNSNGWKNVHVALLIAVLVLMVWSGIHPADRTTWVMEVAPVWIGFALLIPTYGKFRLTNLLYVLLAVHMAILMVGGKYTYAEVPLFNWIRDTFHLSRNHYDRVGHFAQGFVPAILVRELLLRTSPLRAGKWLFVIVVFVCTGFSALYELIEWITAEILGSGADAFLGTQGDVWDTQKDMALAFSGAMAAQVLLARAHDRAIRNIRG